MDPRPGLRRRGGPIGYYLPWDTGPDWLERWLGLWRGTGADQPQGAETIQAGQAYTWRVSLGPAYCCQDTYLVTDEGPELLTRTPDRPADEIEVDGVRTLQPAILVR